MENNILNNTDVRNKERKKFATLYCTWIRQWTQYTLCLIEHSDHYTYNLHIFVAITNSRCAIVISCYNDTSSIHQSFLNTNALSLLRRQFQNRGVLVYPNWWNSQYSWVKAEIFKTIVITTHRNSRVRESAVKKIRDCTCSLFLLIVQPEFLQWSRWWTSPKFSAHQTPRLSWWRKQTPCLEILIPLASHHLTLIMVQINWSLLCVYMRHKQRLLCIYCIIVHIQEIQTGVFWPDSN